MTDYEKVMSALNEVPGVTEFLNSFTATMGREIFIVEKDGVKERPGKGSIHHVAIRVKDGQELRAWDERIRAAGFIPSKIVDRYYFESLYFREHNNILFEIATDGPGFTKWRRKKIN